MSQFGRVPSHCLFILHFRLYRSDDNAEFFSDFYAYHIATNTWNKLFVDIGHVLASKPEIQSVKSRVNHSMLYDDVS